MADVLMGLGPAPEGEPRPAEPTPPSIPALAAKADDLEALRTALIDAAGVSFGLWVSYLFVLFYLLVAAGGVTHRDLFFERAAAVKDAAANAAAPAEPARSVLDRASTVLG